MKTFWGLFYIMLATTCFAQQELQEITHFQSPVGSYYSHGLVEIIDGNGDINGDGFSDLAISGRPVSASDGYSKIYIYFGGAQPDSVVDMVLDDPEDTFQSGFGMYIAMGSDLNGDGIDDLVTSSSRGDGIDPGRVYIYWGGPQINNQPDLILCGENYAADCWGLCFGSQLDTSGDFNGDGYNDLIVDSRGPYEAFPGQINVFYGGPNFDAISDWQVVGETEDFLGEILCVGDYNGDGYDDILASASNSQEARMYYGGASPGNDPAWELLPVHSVFVNFRLNSDLDSDGFHDLVVLDPFSLYMYRGSIEAPTDCIVIRETIYITRMYCCWTDEIPGIYTSMPQQSTVTIQRYISPDSMAVSYTWSGNCYNSTGAGEIDYFVGDFNGDGNEDILQTVVDGSNYTLHILTTKITAASDHVQPVPTKIENYPNPFRHGTTIKLNLRQPYRKAECRIYNLKGQLVKTLHVGSERTCAWDGRDNSGQPVPTGVYLYRAAANGQCSTTGKMTVIK